MAVESESACLDPVFIATRQTTASQVAAKHDCPWEEAGSPDNLRLHPEELVVSSIRHIEKADRHFFSEAQITQLMGNMADFDRRSIPGKYRSLVAGIE